MMSREEQMPIWKRLKFLLLSALLVHILACASSINKAMDSWMGHDVNDLIASWGAPQQTMPDGQGGQILIYVETRQWTTPGYTKTNTDVLANTQGNYNANLHRHNIHGNYNDNTQATANTTTTYIPPETHTITKQRMFWANSSGKLYRWAWKGL
jgi:hypothetical protein